jgi:uncharacterized membrane protein YheB (UPF0754 family)
LLGALIGWSTNVLAIKLIFRPYNEYKFFWFFTIQGLIPKRRSELALVIGQTVERELLSSEEIFNRLSSSDIRVKLTRTISENIKIRLQKFLPAFIPSGIKDHLTNIVDIVIEGEVKHFFQENFPKLSEEIKDTLPIASMIEEKINQLDIKELEKIVLTIAKKELKHIEYLGGILGFIIGLVQGILLIVLTA